MTLMMMCFIAFGRHRLWLAIVTMRGLSASDSAAITTALRAIPIMCASSVPFNNLVFWQLIKNKGITDAPTPKTQTNSTT